MTQFSPVNIVSSDEPLLQMEACDEIVSEVRAKGVEQREIVDVLDKFSWKDLLANSSSLSLFSEIKLTDIRFTKAPNKEAQQALVELAQSASQENLLLIRLPKMEKRQKSAKWFKSLSANARFQELWPPKPHEFPQWLKGRMQRIGVRLAADAGQMLAEQTEGNLLAASQMLDKLHLLYPDEVISVAQLSDIISDNARYSVFLCLDEALAGKGERAVRMLHKFEQEAVAPISILVNLTREVELCNTAALAEYNGQSAMQALAKTFLWDSKKRLIVAAVKRLPAPVWQRLLARLAYLDRMIKGQESGNIWQELELCLWMISGQRIWGRAG
ncbi:DNA polymerase III subunit delta [Aliikangiella coralliicola]|uniref:DNA polymerase III subunit delta n=1 Tax=Aliikangiella coralliicola TaxID=2592383 RepID=A0A545U7K4_9GAMM|nr:DNA polymerase III subunit delta [Aliikangiella coralliicola]TQV85449.1 DNA polymerase III subunit delta [Aliikangiella coralliicola]